MANPVLPQATRMVGEKRLTALLTGSITANLALLQGIEADDAATLLREAGRPVEPVIQVYVYLLKGGGRTILIDGGLGAEGGGALGQELARAGCDPAAIDTILLTHAHSDHVGGLMAADGTAAFPGAEVICADAELAFWSSDERRDAMPEARRASFDGARRFFDTYRDRLRTVSAGEVAPGIEIVPLPGHTPGHSGFRIGGDAEGVLIWGDIVHVPTVQLARPEVTVGFDVEPDVAAATRKALLPALAAAGTPVGGMHLDPPGFLTLRSEGDGFAAT